MESTRTSKHHEADLVAAVVAECHAVQRELDSTQDPLAQGMLHAVLERNKRCLLAYGVHRSRLHSAGAAAVASSSASSSAAERRFWQQQQALEQGVGLALDLDLDATAGAGRGGPFVFARSASQAVSLEGEFSSVSLSAHSEFLIRRGDAKRLSKVGQVNILSL